MHGEAAAVLRGVEDDCCCFVVVTRVEDRACVR